MTREVIARDLDTMRRLGFRAVTVQAGFNMPFDYLSREYFEFFRAVCFRSQKTGHAHLDRRRRWLSKWLRWR